MIIPCMLDVRASLMDILLVLNLQRKLSSPVGLMEKCEPSEWTPKNSSGKLIMHIRMVFQQSIFLITLSSWPQEEWMERSVSGRFDHEN